MVGENLEGETLKNTSIALVTTVVLYFVPGINTLGPVIGGFLGGYLQQEGVTGGIKVGGLKGLAMIIPAFPLALMVGALLNDIPVLGALAAGGTIILAIVIVSHSLLFGIAGGICAGVAQYIVESMESEDRGSAVKQSNNIRTDSDVSNTSSSTASESSDNIRGGDAASSSTDSNDRQIR